MKKSTILMLIVFYIIAFFVVGLKGMELRSHYQVSYINEILVEPFEEIGMTLTEDIRTDLNEEEEKESLKRYTHDYKYRINYTEGMVIKFDVKLVPSNTSISEFQFYMDEQYQKICTPTIDNSDKTIFLSNISKPILSKTEIKFTVSDSQMNGVTSNVSVTIKK